VGIGNCSCLCVFVCVCVCVFDWRMLFGRSGHDSPAEDSFASELSKVEMKDTGTMLANIDSEVSFMVGVGGGGVAGWVGAWHLHHVSVFVFLVSE